MATTYKKKGRNPASDWAWRHNTAKGQAVSAITAMKHVLSSPTVTDEAKELARRIQLDAYRLTEMLKERKPFDG